MAYKCKNYGAKLELLEKPILIKNMAVKNYVAMKISKTLQ